MKTEIENIIYNYADKVKAKYCIFSLGLLINHIQIYRKICQFLQKVSTFSAKKVDLFNRKGRPFLRKR